MAYRIQQQKASDGSEEEAGDSTKVEKEKKNANGYVIDFPLPLFSADIEVDSGALASANYYGIPTTGRGSPPPAFHLILIDGNSQSLPPQSIIIVIN